MSESIPDQPCADGSLPVLTADAEPIRPRRPKPWDPEVTRAAAEDLAEEVAEWMEQAVDEHLITALARSMRSGGNGYDLAKALERDCYISPDAYLVEILDNNGLYEAEKRAVERWVETYGCELSIPDGTMVKFPRGVGEVTGREPLRGTYTVWNEESRSPKQPQCGWVIAAEDCEPIGQEVAAVSDGALAPHAAGEG